MVRPSIGEQAIDRDQEVRTIPIVWNSRRETAQNTESRITVVSLYREHLAIASPILEQPIGNSDTTGNFTCFPFRGDILCPTILVGPWKEELSE